jgi:solute carrier family 25 carnitine/acylcarnitine transporter 20/29
MSLQSILPDPGGFIAGAVAGICGVAVSQPFDIIKVRLQNTGGNDLSVFKSIVKTEGFLSLWRGGGISSFGAIFGCAISFGVVENCKSYMMKNRDQPLTIWEHGLCGAWSGLATSFLSSPTEAIRIRLQMQKVGNKDNKNTWQWIREMFKFGGLGGIFKGFWLTTFRDVIGDGVYFAVYQAAPRWFYKDMENTENRSYFVIMMAGGLSGVVGWTAIYPIDTVKSRIQADSVVNPKYKGAFDCFFQTIKQDGVGQLFKGYFTCVLRAFPLNMAFILGFEYTMKFLGRDF